MAASGADTTDDIGGYSTCPGCCCRLRYAVQERLLLVDPGTDLSKHAGGIAGVMQQRRMNCEAILFEWVFDTRTDDDPPFSHAVDLIV